MPGKRKQQQQKFLMEILESETIISLLSFSILEEIRWSPLEAPKKLPVAFLQPRPSRSGSSVEASSVVPPCPAHPCGPLCPACWPRRLPPSLPTPPGLTLLGALPGSTFWFSLFSQETSPQGWHLYTWVKPLCICWVNTLRTEFQRMHMVPEYLFHFCVIITRGIVVTLLWRKFSSKYLPHGCYNRVSQAGRLRTTEIYFLQFCRLEVKNHSVGRAMLPLTPAG